MYKHRIDIKKIMRYRVITLKYKRYNKDLEFFFEHYENAQQLFTELMQKVKELTDTENEGNVVIVGPRNN